MVLECKPRFLSEDVPTAELEISEFSSWRIFHDRGESDEVIDLILISIYIAPFWRNRVFNGHYFNSPGGIRQAWRAEQSSPVILGIISSFYNLSFKEFLAFGQAVDRRVEE